MDTRKGSFPESGALRTKAEPWLLALALLVLQEISRTEEP
jgi:hypothetical protein